MKILGIWDGHDAGAAIIERDEIKVAFNEERLSRRKLDVGFPTLAIKACLDYLKLSPQEIDVVATTTSDLSKTLTRFFPSLKEKYYLIRRRQSTPRFMLFQKQIKYLLTEFGPNPITTDLSNWQIKKELAKLGFANYQYYMVDHHLAHAATCFCSGFNKGLALSIDGVGDGLSASVNRFSHGKIERLEAIGAKDSLGIFFEHVTNLLNMRELEDEGKVMALADFAYDLNANPMLELFTVEGMKIKAAVPTSKMKSILEKILWATPAEQFARMAQDALEHFLIKWVENCLRETGEAQISLSGGVASNIKANQKIRRLPQVKDWFVFPHMGDGGLAIGAALYINSKLNNVANYKFDNIYFGKDYSNEEIETALKQKGLKYSKEADIAAVAAKLLAEENIVFWFQGRMELGPRALGNRSILAKADSEKCKNDLNLKIKKRVWYQPFCPTLLEENIQDYISDYSHQPDRFMTMGYSVKADLKNSLKAVVNVDGSCRPQMLGKENPKFRKLLEAYQKLTGQSIILNTSFNQHGEPIVESPANASETFIKTKNKYLAIGDFLAVQ
ncbi:MAG: carbamoyltransferase C-terminal domain-containing protein [bacterium]